MSIPIVYKKSFEELIRTLTDDCLSHALLPLHALPGFTAREEEDFGYPELPQAGSYALWSLAHCALPNAVEDYQSEPVIRLNIIRSTPFGWTYTTQFEVDGFEAFNCPIDFLIHTRKAFDMLWRTQVVDKYKLTLQTLQKINEDVVSKMMEDETIQ